MPEYQLEIKQLVSYPRCRIHHEMLQTLTADRDIRINGHPGLFAFTALCSLASSRTTSLQMEGISYTVHSGECICSIKELKNILRLQTRRQTLRTLQAMQNRSLLQYTVLARGKLVKFSIREWQRCNCTPSDDCPAQKPGQFFFLPSAVVAELVSSTKCSEMDILLDLFCSAVYRDARVKGSYSGPIVYFRNGTGNAVVTCEDLCKRWGLSYAAVSRVLHKFESTGYIALHRSPFCREVFIYLSGGISTAFQVSDILVDKDELPMCMRMKLSCAANESSEIDDLMTEKVCHILALQGIGCVKCNRCKYDLYPLSQAEQCTNFRMDIRCGWGTSSFSFDLFLSPIGE